MSERSSTTRLLTAALLAGALQSAHGQGIIHESQDVYSIHPASSDGFGGAIVLRGQTLLVGATSGDTGVLDGGEVQHFDLGAAVTFQGVIVAGDPETGASFGASAALDGDLLVVGANHHDHGVPDAGAAYVLRRSGTTWVEEAELLAGDRATDDEFGSAVAVQGNRIAVGAPGCDIAGQAEQGAVYVFEQVGGAWVQTHKVVAWDGKAQDKFGHRVVLEGDRLAASSSMQFAGGEGSVHILRASGATWLPEGKLVPSWGITFGHALQLEGDRLAIGSPYRDTVDLFLWNGTAWTAEVELHHKYTSGDIFGASVCLQGERLVTGAPMYPHWGMFSGMSFVFERVGGAWTETLRLAPSWGGDSHQAGTVLAFDGDRVACNNGEAVQLFDLAALVGDFLCSGDGSGSPCPCGNECDAGMDHGCENALGMGAHLAGLGSTSVLLDDLRLSSAFMTMGATAVAFVGRSTLLGGTGRPFGDGLLCIGGQVRRLGVVVSNPGGSGVAVFGPGLATQGAWFPGETCYFQVWYRDGVGPCGHAYSLTNALEVTFTQ